MHFNRIKKYIFTVIDTETRYIVGKVVDSATAQNVEKHLLEENIFKFAGFKYIQMDSYMIRKARLYEEEEVYDFQFRCSRTFSHNDTGLVAVMNKTF